ncbi:hypothetical protein evm_014710 [Chilo suppressalis]|nr:hypothetical protein evm_014710 [Chilo suppressalis]
MFSVYDKDLIQEATMQLHLLDNSSDPMLLQLLWGDMVTAVIYWKHKSAVVKPEQLKPALELVEQLRGPQSVLRICSKHYREKLSFD